MKASNEYADSLGAFYAATPKAVFAAIATSALTTGGEHIGEARARLLREWWALHHAGIVPQRPPGPEVDVLAEDAQ